jgi:phosphatidylglycerol lysyltransferase
MKNKIFHYVGIAIGLILFSVAMVIIHRELKTYHYHDIVNELASVPHRAVALAMLFTALNFMVLGAYEILGFRYIKNNLPWYKTLLTSFIAFSFSNNVGFYSVSGSAVRYRLYSQWGLSTLDIAKLIAFSSGITFFLGLCAICSLVFIVEPPTLPATLHLPLSSFRLSGWLFLIPVIAFVTLTAVRKKPIHILSWEFDSPSPVLTIMLILFACLDWLFFAAVLYCLLPAAHVSFPLFVSIFLTAQVIGLISHVPGGLGVFESMILLLLPNVPAATTIGALALFRGIYYLLPLGLSALLLGGRELFLRKKQVSDIAQTFSQWGSGVIPLFYSAITFIGGIILLASGATPTAHHRMHWLTHIMPLPVLEISHFMASLFGVALLVLAHGLYRRFDSAWHMTLYLLAGGAIFTFMKGLDYEEAIILTTMFLALLPSRRHFYRKAALVNDRFSAGWIVTIAFTMASIVWLGFFSYKHIAYSNELWWQFGFDNHASRFLRASIGGCIALFGYALLKLTSPARRVAVHETAVTIASIRPLVDSASRSSAFLAFLGDKSFLTSDSGDAFIMYGIQGKTWVAMGDPIGKTESYPPLIWKFKELCDCRDERAVFYEIGTRNLHHYLDAGLTLFKIGEEARVNLASFSLDGNSKKTMRYNCRKIDKDGWAFKVVPAEGVMDMLPALKAVSDEWLAKRTTREKRFSLGYFSPSYLKETPVGIVTKDGEIAAFANIWPTGTKEELSIDLMRYGETAPKGVMEYLFVNLISWGKEQGFQWFDLGMAPLSGLDNRIIAPLWNRLGAYLFTHGENIYNFQGLRQYKEKFDPQWEPKYLAVPGVFSLPMVLKDLSTLISGGLKGVISK